MERTKKLISNSIIFTLGNIGSKLIAFLMVPLYTYTLSSSEFGQVDVLITTVNLLLPIATLSIFDAVFRFSMDRNVDNTAILTSGLIVTVFLAFMGMLFYPVLVFANIPHTLYFILILVTTSLFTLIQNFSRAIGKSKLYATSGIVNGFMFATLNILFLVILKIGIIGYLLAYLLSLICATIYVSLMLKIWRYIKINSFSLSIVKQMLRYSIPLIPNSLAWWFTNDASRFFILAYVGVAGNGIFAVANKIPSLLNMMFNIFTQAWQISAVEEYDSKDSSLYYSSIFNTLQSFLFLVIGGILIIIKPILQFVISSDFPNVWKFVPILLFSAVFANLSAFLGTVFLAAKKTSGLFTTTVVGMVINITISWILTPYLGINGTSLGGAIGFCIVMLVRLNSINKYIHVQVDWFIFTLSMISTILMSYAIYLSGFYQYLFMGIGFAILLISNFSVIKSTYSLLKNFRSKKNNVD